MTELDSGGLEEGGFRGRVLYLCRRIAWECLSDQKAWRGVLGELHCSQVLELISGDNMGCYSGGKKSEVVVWDKKSWGSIGAKTFCDNILYPALFPIWLE